jgi:hypothetical protein
LRFAVDRHEADLQRSRTSAYGWQDIHASDAALMGRCADLRRRLTRMSGLPDRLR